ncbi:MAG TPA: hypothetical protein VKE40_08055 [Gemmataceae bacterium]|nr:hypothetical protein [Gemmataceae bacterium]
MIDERTVLLTLGGTLALGVLVIAYLQEPLRRVLFDICRKRDHARFWASCANVLILAIPVAVELLLIDIRPWSESNLFWILHQVKWAVLGLVVAVIVVAVGVMMLGRSASVPVWVNPQDMDDLNRLLSRVQEVRARELAERGEATRADF